MLLARAVILPEPVEQVGAQHAANQLTLRIDHGKAFDQMAVKQLGDLFERSLRAHGQELGGHDGAAVHAGQPALDGFLLSGGQQLTQILGCQVVALLEALQQLLQILLAQCQARGGALGLGRLGRLVQVGTAAGAVVEHADCSKNA